MDYKPKSREDVLFKEMDDGGVIYEPSSEKCHSLNATSAYIWALCDGTYSISEIIEMITADFDTYDTDPENAVKDIITKFQDLGLMES